MWCRLLIRIICSKGVFLLMARIFLFSDDALIVAQVMILTHPTPTTVFFVLSASLFLTAGNIFRPMSLWGAVSSSRPLRNVKIKISLNCVAEVTTMWQIIHMRNFCTSVTSVTSLPRTSYWVFWSTDSLELGTWAIFNFVNDWVNSMICHHKRLIASFKHLNSQATHL